MQKGYKVGNPMQPVRRLVIRIAVLAILLAACSPATTNRPAPTPTIAGGYAVDPVLREFYFYLGGEKILGRPIEPPVFQGAGRSQHLEKAQLVYDPTANIKKYFTLAPIGREMMEEEPPIPRSEANGQKWVDGHIIAPEFVPVYEKLGPLTVGKPLTEARYDPIRRRYTQYFENVGMYRLEGRTDVHLLDYGVWACEDCRGKVTGAFDNNATIDYHTEIDPTFAPFIEQLGPDFTGYAIFPAYLNRDGRWEQIFENVVLTASEAGDSSDVKLRPVVEDVNLSTESPRPSSKKPDFHFYPVLPNMGYDIPENFWEYLTRHGGLAMSGPPVTHVAPLNGQVFQQCFTNLCLLFDLQAPTSRQVRPSPLGQTYKMIVQPRARSANSITAPQDVRLAVWERYPVVTSRQMQEIGVSVQEDGQPAAGLSPTLNLMLPGGVEKIFAFPATNPSGRSTLRLEPIVAPSGTLILYRVCVSLSPGKPTCQGDSFVIWNNP